MAAARLVGIDVARALALFGMFGAHVGDVPPFVDWAEPSTWLAVVHGRSSTLFAVLAGVSVALTTGGAALPSGIAPLSRDRAAAARWRLARRALAVFLIGVALAALGTPVYVILPTYGALFLLAVPALRWGRRSLLVAAGVCAALSVPAALATAIAFGEAGDFAVQFGVVYPVVTFLAYLLVGVAIGRTRLTDRRVQVAMLVGGAVLAAVAYGVGQAAAPIDPEAYRFPGVPPIDQGAAATWFSPADHTSTIVDVLGTTGVAVAVIGLCTLLFDGPHAATAARFAAPLAAAGSMPLSVYAAHLVVIAVLQARPDGIPDGPALASALVLGAMAAAWTWRRFLGRGPLERLVARVAGP